MDDPVRNEKPGACASGRNQNQRVGLPEEPLVFYRVSVIPYTPESLRRGDYTIKKNKKTKNKKNLTTT
jgi:hypothetical protein